MDRLSTLDAEFLHLEDGIVHMHIAGVSVFEGPPPSEKDVRHLIGSKLHLIPRYRQRVRFVPMEIGRPVWVDDPHFNLRYHVRHTALPAPGTDADLCLLMARLMSQPLDRNRPLWEAWVVENLPGGRWAMISKVHHCMVDGISGVELLTVLLDAERDATRPTPPPWEPAPEPGWPALVVDAWSGLAGDLGRLAGELTRAVRDPIGSLRGGERAIEGLLSLGRNLVNTAPLSIEGSIGPHRTWAHSSSSLADVRVVRQAFGGTINDIVLSAVTSGYRTLLLSRGEDADHARVRTLVPVSVRTEDTHDAIENRVSAILFELPVHLADPLERLRAVEQRMPELKHSGMPEAGVLVTSMGDLAPPMVVGAVTRVGVRMMHQLSQRSINTVTTNVPGPQFPLYCLGREMLEYRPFVPIAHGVRVGTAILSYNGTLFYGVTGDFDTAPDVDVLATAIADGILELHDLAVAHLAAEQPAAPTT
ncbi:MAG: WS/DGAT/MGAT family O-acyltransferase [Acidimicrobiales bacterium]